MAASQDIARALADLRRQVSALARASRLGRSSIDSGALTVTDDGGETVATIGRQPDGRVAISGPVFATDIELPEGSITETDIADDSISTPKVRANCITADKIATDAIQARHIAADAIDGRVITGVTVNAGELITSDPDGSFVHIYDDPGNGGAAIDMGLPTIAGTTLSPATLRTGVEPETGSAATVLRGPDIDAQGTAEIRLSSASYGGTLSADAGHFWFTSDGGATWNVAGDWEIARPVEDEPGEWQPSFQVRSDGSVHAERGQVTSLSVGDDFNPGELDVFGPVTAEAVTTDALTVNGPVTLGSAEPVEVVTSANDTTTSTSYTAGTDNIAEFVAPPSGTVYVTFGGWIGTNGTSGSARSYLSDIVREGPAGGGGAIVVAADDTRALVIQPVAAASGFKYHSGTIRHRVAGLTPGAAYHVQTVYRSQQATDTAAVHHRRILVEPTAV